jgi:hypothetical protein
MVLRTGNIGGELDCEHLSMEERLIRRQKLQDASEILEIKKTTNNLKQTFDEVLKQHRKSTFKIRGDFITKLLHTAQWGDKNNKISGIIQALESSSHVEFYKAIKSLSSNVPPAGLTKGPVDGIIWNNRIRADNTMYNILKKALVIAIRGNEHFIKRIIRHEEEDMKIAEEKEKAEIAEAERLKKIEEKRIKKEQEEKLKSFSAVENWEDLIV